MSTSTRDRIISYLGQGIQASIVATSCGVTPGYISQLLELPEVREEIAKLQAGKLEAALEADERVETVEMMALKMVKDKLPFVRSAVEAAKIFATLNAAKRKAAPNGQTADVLAGQQVTIVVPRGAALHFKLNSSNQVIEVDGRAMAPLPSRALPALQKERLGVTDLEPLVVQAPTATAATTHAAKADAADSARATNMLRDLTTVLNGVAVVL